MKRRLGGLISFVKTLPLILSSCEGAGSASPEKEPVAEPNPAEVIPPIAVPAIEEVAEGGLVDVDVTRPVDTENIVWDAELRFINPEEDGERFHQIRKQFEEGKVTTYAEPFGTLFNVERGVDTGFTVLAVGENVISNKLTGEITIIGEYQNGLPGSFVMDTSTGLFHGTQAWRYDGNDLVEDQVLFRNNEGIVTGYTEDALVERRFGYTFDENGQILKMYLFDEDGIAHGVTNMGFAGKMAMPEKSQVWYLMAKGMIGESGNPDEWSWRYAEDGTLNLVRVTDKEYVYVWDEESKEWVDSALAGLPEEVQLLIDAGNPYNLEDGIVMSTDGRKVVAARGLSGEWGFYENGIVQIPAGDGSGELPFGIEYFGAVNDFVSVYTNLFPWDDRTVRRQDIMQLGDDKIVMGRYMIPFIEHMGWKDKLSARFLSIHNTNSLDGQDHIAEVTVANFFLPNGREVTWFYWWSVATDYNTKVVLVDGKMDEIVAKIDALATCRNMGTDCETDLVIPYNQ